MKCANCNQSIPEDRVNRNAKRYCSEKCHREYWLKVGRKVFKEKKCSICETLFMPKSSLQKHCSHRCKYISDLRRHSKNPQIKKCNYCGKEFEPYTNLDKFCSANCRIENQKSKRSKRWGTTENIIGENNPGYRNGNFVRGRKKITAGERIFIKNSKEKKQAMINDKGYIYCEYCNTSNSLRFEAHHIIYRSERPLHKHLHGKENILIVCIKCHNELHKHKDLRNKIVNQRGLNHLFATNT